MRLVARCFSIALLGLCPVGALARDGGNEPMLRVRDPLKPITSMSTSIQPQAGRLPTDYSGQVDSQATESSTAGLADRPWTGICWTAPGICYQPLYFEDPALERHGYCDGLLQPLVSTAHFVGNAAILPYRLAAEPPCECIYTLGHERPGTPTPMHCYRPPLRVSGGLAEAGVVTGLIFLLP